VTNFHLREVVTIVVTPSERVVTLSAAKGLAKRNFKIADTANLICSAAAPRFFAVGSE